MNYIVGLVLCKWRADGEAKSTSVVMQQSSDSEKLFSFSSSAQKCVIQMFRNQRRTCRHMIKNLDTVMIMCIGR